MVTLAKPMQTIRSIKDATQGWPRSVKKIAEQLVKKYDLPHEATDHMLVWYFNDPWHKTVLHRKGAYHNFPYPHQDILEQSVQYRVPIDKYEDLIAYNGSIVVDRTGGTLTAHCNTEAMNFLTMNLAHQIILGEITVEQARQKHIHTAMAMRLYWSEPLVEGLTFAAVLAEYPSADPDTASQEALINRNKR